MGRIAEDGRRAGVPPLWTSSPHGRIVMADGRDPSSSPCCTFAAAPGPAVTSPSPGAAGVRRPIVATETERATEVAYHAFYIQSRLGEVKELLREIGSESELREDAAEGFSFPRFKQAVCSHAHFCADESRPVLRLIRG